MGNCNGCAEPRETAVRSSRRPVRRSQLSPRSSLGRNSRLSSRLSRASTGSRESAKGRESACSRGSKTSISSRESKTSVSKSAPRRKIQSIAEYTCDYTPIMEDTLESLCNILNEEVNETSDPIERKAISKTLKERISKIQKCTSSEKLQGSPNPVIVRPTSSSLETYGSPLRDSKRDANHCKSARELTGRESKKFNTLMRDIESHRISQKVQKRQTNSPQCPRTSELPTCELIEEIDDRPNSPD